jgi:DNA-binding IclR family transcriptional regulator
MNFAGKTSLKPAVPALVRGFDILDLLSTEPGLTFTEIHTRLRLPKSSAFQLIATLCNLGVVRSQPDGRYCLGLRLSELGASAVAQRRIDREAQPHLIAFARHTQLTCHLGVLEGHEAVYLCKEQCEQEIKIANTWVGKRLALNRSSLGKVLLAWLPEPEIDALATFIDWERKTPATLASAADLKAHLQLVRRQGWASDDEEDVPNIRCVAVPVRDGQGHVVAAISAVGTVLQIGSDAFGALAEQLLIVAKDIENSLRNKSR